MNEPMKKIIRPAVWTVLRAIERIKGLRMEPRRSISNRVKMLFDLYEPEVINAMKTRLPRGGTFVDVGANVGYVSVKMAQQCGPNGMVHAFEPNPNIFGLLKQNTEKYPWIFSQNIALGAKKGELAFFVGADSNVGSLVPGYTEAQHHSGDNKEPIRTLSVKVVPADECLGGIGVIDVVKVDVEGYELDVFNGMDRLLRMQRIRSVFFEFCPFAQRCAGRNPLDLVNYLWKVGYRVMGVEGGLKDRLLESCDVGELLRHMPERAYTTFAAEVVPKI